LQILSARGANKEFGHVVRLDATTPAHQALDQVIALKGGWSPGINWRTRHYDDDDDDDGITASAGVISAVFKLRQT